MGHITWSAKGRFAGMCKEHAAPSKLAAVRAGRKFVRENFSDEGAVRIFRNGALVETHECGAFTKHRWIKY